MAVIRQTTAFLRQHSIPDVAQLHPIFTKTGIVFRIQMAVFNRDIRRMQPGANLSGKKIGPGDPDRTDSIKSFE